MFVEAQQKEAYIEYLLVALDYGNEADRLVVLKNQAHAIPVLGRLFTEEPVLKGA